MSKLTLAVKILVAALCVILAIIALGATWRMLDPRHTNWIVYRPAIICMAIGLVLGSMKIASGFYRTLEHELTHVIFGLLFLRRARRMLVTDSEGGYAVRDGGPNWLGAHWFISLCPYFFPLTAMILAGLSFIVMASLKIWLQYLVLIALGYHLASITREIKTGQTDLSKHGNIFSACFIAGIGTPLITFLLTYAIWGPGSPGLWFDSCKVVLNNGLRLLHLA